MKRLCRCPSKHAISLSPSLSLAGLAKEFCTGCLPASRISNPNNQKQIESIKRGQRAPQQNENMESVDDRAGRWPEGREAGAASTVGFALGRYLETPVTWLADAPCSPREALLILETRQEL